ncbi:Ig-like domain-containing protein [Couchioplanes azureus]|uniref:Ig-like domain-containing protein n=1 Tax=Couchioplanes caeruleus TaxID=56438 RepID=UPI00166F6B60|nr:Ig-like domain-containing protein [Couchioplanes caeruleus]
MIKMRSLLGAATAAILLTGVAGTPARAAENSDPTLSVFYDAVDGYVSKYRAPHVYMSDPDGVRKGELWIDGVLVDTFADLSGGPLWDMDAKNGPVTMTIKAFDMWGNVSEYTRRVIVDSDAPVVTLSPAKNAFVRGTLKASVTAVRDYSGIGELASAIVAAGTPNVTIRKAPWSIPLNTRRVRDGKQAIFFAVTDKAGNGTYVERAVTVDNTAPSVSLTQAPRNKARVTKKFTVAAKATDRFGIARVQLLVNGKVVATDGKAAYRFTVNPKKYGKKFTVQLRAYDKAGNVKTTAKRTYRR